MIVRKIRIKDDAFAGLKSKIPGLPDPVCCINPASQQNEVCREYDIAKDRDGNPVPKDGKTVSETYVVFYNEPDEDYCEPDSFVKLLDVIADFNFVRVSKERPYGVPFIIDNDARLAELTIKAKKQNLRLKHLGGKEYTFTEKITRWESDVTLKYDQGEVTLKGVLDAEGMVERSGVLQQSGDVFVSSKGLIEVFLKTPQQMLFYLGRVAGIQLANNNAYGQLAKTFWNYEYKPFFIVNESDQAPQGSAVKVEYNGKWYSIPSSSQLSRTDISTSTLSFIKQVIGLNTSKDDLKTNTGVFTGVVVQ